MTSVDFINGIEPDAVKLYADSEVSLDRTVAISQALSLKRIADALWGIEGTAGLLELLNPLDVRNNF